MCPDSQRKLFSKDAAPRHTGYRAGRRRARIRRASYPARTQSHGTRDAAQDRHQYGEPRRQIALHLSVQPNKTRCHSYTTSCLTSASRGSVHNLQVEEINGKQAASLSREGILGKNGRMISAPYLGGGISTPAKYVPQPIRPSIAVNIAHLSPRYALLDLPWAVPSTRPANSVRFAHSDARRAASGAANIKKRAEYFARKKTRRLFRARIIKCASQVSRRQASLTTEPDAHIEGEENGFTSRPWRAPWPGEPFCGSRCSCA